MLYTTAIDKNGGWVRINNAEKGMSYFCPTCSEEFILRKSGKTGKGSKRPHFSHNGSAPNCTPEGVLHYSFKKMLIDLLERYKTENKPFILNWDCNSCDYKNSGNLIEKIAFIKEEHVLGAYRTDIALIDKAENVLAVIEVVVTHKPEESVLQYYKDKKITLIQINLTSEDDLNKIEEKAKSPDLVDLCLNPKCRNHDNQKIDRKITPLWKQCRCLSPIQELYVDIYSIFGGNRSRDFTNNEIDSIKLWADQNGALVQTVDNQDTKEKYPVFICQNCQRMRSRGRLRL